MNAATEFDVFVSYNTLDHAAVERIARALTDRHLTVFLDRWELVPGRPWPDALEQHLGRCRSAAVVLGPSGMGPWQQREHYLALDRQARDASFGVIPVILPNADPALGFLSLNTWVDLRGGLDDAEAIDLLAAAVRGEPPSALLERTRQAAAQVCPYRGLEVFREEDAAFFFGREDFTSKLREAVAERSLIAVVGASGSGKSSVVRAGLIPSLRRSDGGTVWEVATLVPGGQPLHALTGTLLPLLEPELNEVARLVELNKLAEHLRAGDLQLHQVIERVIRKQQGTDRLLLVVDQWEELYTHAKDEESENASARFVDELLTATEAAPLTVVLTLRADFYGEVLAHRGLSDRLQAAQVNLGPMTREELERAVTAPAEKVRLGFDTGLVDHLLDDVGSEPGNLPLLEFALRELWSARRGNQLLYDVYKTTGGVKGAIAQRAETVFETLDPSQRKTAEQVFVALVRPGDETGDTRRRAQLREFDQAGQALVRRLAGPHARLLITGRDMGTEQDTVEVAHEALIRHWGRLQHWLGQNRDFLLWRQRLEAALGEWERTEKDAGTLLRGALLAEAERWFAERAEDLTETEAGFVGASLAGQRARRRGVWTSVAVTLLLAVSAALWQYTEVQRLRAERAPMLPEMVIIEPGTFMMGSPNTEQGGFGFERPVREVTLKRRFAIGKYEVTFAEYDRFALATERRPPCDQGFGGGRRPVINVSWHDAADYAKWLSEQTGRRYRLPTEAEWEYAVRAKTTTYRFWGPDSRDACRYANVYDMTGEPKGKATHEFGWKPHDCDDGFEETAPVGSFEANPWGLFDTAGNVWEWVQDCWHENYESAPAEQTAWLEAGGGDCGQRVFRGGAWNSIPEHVRSASRDRRTPDFQYFSVGFRLAQDL